MPLRAIQTNKLFKLTSAADNPLTNHTNCLNLDPGSPWLYMGVSRMLHISRVYNYDIQCHN